MRRDDHEVGRHAVALHAVLAVLYDLVQTALVLLASGVHRDFGLHRHTDVALGANGVALVVREIIIRRREVL